MNWEYLGIPLFIRQFWRDDGGFGTRSFSGHFVKTLCINDPLKILKSCLYIYLMCVHMYIYIYIHICGGWPTWHTWFIRDSIQTISWITSHQPIFDWMGWWDFFMVQLVNMDLQINAFGRSFYYSRVKWVKCAFTNIWPMQSKLM